MKKALFKDSIKQIKNTYKRFISILLMAFLGVGFFAGIRVTSPDMVDTISKYYEENNVYDIQVLSTLGLTQNDISEISKIDKIEEAIGAYETDGKLEIENEELIVKVMCIDEINKPVLLQGKMPESQDECVVEERFLTFNNKNIGDTIELDIKNTRNINGEEVKYLNQNKLKIVGTVKSPLYISSDRGTSNLGSGKINYYMYITKENVNAKDIYTSLYIKVKDAKKYTTSSKKYEECVNEAKKEIEKIKEQRVKIDGIENPTWYILDRYGNSGYNSFIQDTQSVENLGKVFPIVFFVIALLISLTSMTRMVEEQRTQIGTLKALRI